MKGLGTEKEDIMVGQIKRLITITRNDISSGKQLAQTIHSVSQYSLEHPTEFQLWNNSYIISLSATNEKLHKILSLLNEIDVKVSYFTEPDLNDELTSICFLETLETKKITKNLKLSLSDESNLDR